MPLLSFGEWKPDRSNYESATTQNVLPRGDGHGPWSFIGGIEPDFATEGRR
jgi:hypothetical protein